MRKLTILSFFTLTIPLAAQWSNVRDPQTPRRNGKPDLTAPAPRVSGRPDLSGVWQAERPPLSEINSVLGPDFASQQIDIADVGKYYINVFGASRAIRSRYARRPAQF